jgi:Acyl-CoA dehydrogenase, N-terminal domain
MRRDLFTEDHEAFRELAREFVEKEVVPAYPEWEKAGRIAARRFQADGRSGRTHSETSSNYLCTNDRQGIEPTIVRAGRRRVITLPRTNSPTAGIRQR